MWSGVFRRPIGRDFFLPPHHLVHQLDERFASAFHRRLETPLTELVQERLAVLGEDGAERHCDGLGLPQLLRLLQKQALWTEGGSIQLARAAPQVVVCQTPQSPRIELVKDETIQGDYGIRDGGAPPQSGRMTNMTRDMKTTSTTLTSQRRRSSPALPSQPSLPHPLGHVEILPSTPTVMVRGAKAKWTEHRGPAWARVKLLIRVVKRR